MPLPVLTISTDKPKYQSYDDVIVTASMTQWYPGVKIRLVIWDILTTQPVLNKYFDKPTTGDTIKWTISGDSMTPFVPGDFYAQIEFGNLEAHAEFFYT